ncbi:hypothetical protein EGM97_21470 [Pseudomonas sp. AF32]|nr:hypothetical protein [Pseudomonas sp. AF32]
MLRFDMAFISFDSKDNVSNQNLLQRVRQGEGRKIQKRSDTCGSGLAREGGGSTCIYFECADAFASKPAPTLGCG